MDFIYLYNIYLSRSHGSTNKVRNEKNEIVREGFVYLFPILHYANSFSEIHENIIKVVPQ